MIELAIPKEHKILFLYDLLSLDLGSDTMDGVFSNYFEDRLVAMREINEYDLREFKGEITCDLCGRQLPDYEIYTGTWDSEKEITSFFACQPCISYYLRSFQ